MYSWSDRQLDQLKDQLHLLVKDAMLKELSAKHTDPHSFWKAVGEIEKGGVKCYSLIRSLAMLLLVIPHSNAEPERVFSMINKNLTPERRTLDKDTTLNNIMIIKTRKLPLDFVPSKELLSLAKKATRLMLNQPLDNST